MNEAVDSRNDPIETATTPLHCEAVVVAEEGKNYETEDTALSVDNSDDSRSTESLCSCCKFELNELYKEESRKTSEETVEAQKREVERDNNRSDLLQVSKTFSGMNTGSVESFVFDIDPALVTFLPHGEYQRRSDSSEDSSVQIISVKENEKLFTEKIIPTVSEIQECASSANKIQIKALLNNNVQSDSFEEISTGSRRLFKSSSKNAASKGRTEKKIQTCDAANFQNITDRAANISPRNESSSETSNSAEINRRQFNEESCRKEEDNDLKSVRSKCAGLMTHLVNRKRRLYDLTNDVHKASCSLDEIRKVLAAVNSSKISINPSAPKLIKRQGIDFAQRDRLIQQPVTVDTEINEESSHFKGSSAVIAHVNHLLANKLLTPQDTTTGTTSASSALKKTIYQVPASQAGGLTRVQKLIVFGVSKENKKTRGSQNTNGKEKITSMISSFNNKDSNSDSGSMYEYNPYTCKRKKENSVK